jgi:hypothetical protein
MITTAQAVASLRPNVEWTMRGEDVEGIIWHTPNVTPLTRAEVDAEVARLEQVAVEKETAASAARDAAVAHARTLGFTDEMITVMYPSLGVAQ